MILARSSSSLPPTDMIVRWPTSAPTIVHGSLCPLRICRLADVLAPTPLASRGRRRHGQAIQLQSRGSAARPAGISGAISILQLGPRPGIFGTGSAADLSIIRAPRPDQRKEYRLSWWKGPFGGGNRPILGPKKISRFQVIALAAASPLRLTKGTSPRVPRR